MKSLFAMLPAILIGVLLIAIPFWEARSLTLQDMVKWMIGVFVASVMGLCVYTFVVSRSVCVWEFRCTYAIHNNADPAQETTDGLGFYSGPEIFPYRFIEKYLKEHAYTEGSAVEYLKGGHGGLRLTVGGKNKAEARQRVEEIKAALESQISNHYRLAKERLMVEAQESAANAQKYLQHAQILIETLKIE